MSRVVVALLLIGSGCGRSAWTDRELAQIRSLSPVPPPPPSPTNAVADDPRAAAVGEKIFNDPGFSVDGTVSCSTCHQREKHFTNGESVATTTRGAGRRNVPTAEGAAWNTWFFWDGRSDSAWAQATGPLTNPIEHATTAVQVQARVQAAYFQPFVDIFGAVDPDPQRVLAQVGKVVEAYERTLRPGPSRFDRYVATLPQDSDALSETEKEGLRLFIGDAGCINCHNGPMFSDRSFHNIGLPFNGDMGRLDGASQVLASPLNCLSAYSDGHDCAELRFLDPKFADWPAAFKTPSLRNVSQTAPYMHDGSMATLMTVLAFYNSLPEPVLVGHRELTLQSLHYTGEKLVALEAFLRSLDAER